MAHFAQIDADNVVVQVIVVSDNDTQNDDGIETETIGAEFCHNLLGGQWVQTSYSGRIRKRFAGIGYTYDKTLDAFIPPKPYPSWILNNQTANWQAPIAHEDLDGWWIWDEITQTWSR